MNRQYDTDCIRFAERIIVELFFNTNTVQYSNGALAQRPILYIIARKNDAVASALPDIEIQ